MGKNMILPSRRRSPRRISHRLGLAVAIGLSGAACAGSPRPAPASPLENIALRASQAPIVGLADIVSVDTLVGKRVRVLGWCASAPGLLAGMLVGARSGAWYLATADTTVEVRGSVPRACDPEILRQTLVLIFAQVVAAKPHSRERLLLRLPD